MGTPSAYTKNAGLAVPVCVSFLCVMHRKDEADMALLLMLKNASFLKKNEFVVMSQQG
ncbi:hypothetical protein [Litchfieldella anticariensis]|uniref:hypothetical protein n=1 Tax=Litchfieldella anticariensis TaxID=258591 RepID=UPI0012B53007|nr:hypothetical protein [Halomonas anticariensis]